ncbi:MAG TPA: immunoglobulin domain-containing protein [Verrucomicrobiae bacterium]|nr:immunoglobulin domain-containing protein [Verrucomicrobiae bacterium]
MKTVLTVSAMAAAAACFAQVNVTQYHNDLARTGLYVDPAFTTNAVAGLKRDTNFNGSVIGGVYAQPLYIEGGPDGRALIIAATSSDNIYALDATNGAIVWQANVGSPVPLSSQPCGIINPLGIVGTPVVDLTSRSLFFDAAVTPDGTTTKHLVFSFNVDTGTTNSGWPVDVGASARFGNTTFQPATHHERGALAFLGGSVYIPYGGHYGDCGSYHGWLVAIQGDNPSAVTAWATAAGGGGVWAVGGVASDGTNLFVATGNTFGAATWSGGEAIIRLRPGAVFSTNTADYWAPTNWKNLDNSDLDLGGTGPLLLDVPGATPSKLIVALGKDANAYLLDRSSLGGVSAPLAQKQVASGAIIQAAATYRTRLGTRVVFKNGTQLSSFPITAGSPPAIGTGWTANQNGSGSPFVTSTDGTNNLIVWGIGCEGDQKLHAFDGDTGAVLFSGGTASDAMTGTHHMNTAIVARGRIFVGADNRVFAFGLPMSAPSITTQPTNETVIAGGGADFQLAASGTAPLSYQWFFNGNSLAGATDPALVLSNVQPGQAGPYNAVVRNTVGSATSLVAQLTVLLPPSISTVALNGTTMSVSFTTLSGPHYVLEYKDTLTAPSWTVLPQSLVGTGGTLTLRDTNPPGSARFYRIRSD